VRPAADVIICALTHECDFSSEENADAIFEWKEAAPDVIVAIRRVLNNDRLYYPHSDYPLG
jgi:hypothetical protein